MSYRISKSGLVELLAQCLEKHGSMAGIREHLAEIGRSPDVDPTVSPEFIVTNELSRYPDRDDIVATAAARVAVAMLQTPAAPAMPAQQEGDKPEALRWPFVVASALSFVAIADLPYAYYQILRWIVCGAAIMAAMKMHASGRIFAMGALAVVALIFNPLIRFHFSKETWTVWNVVAGIALVSSTILLPRRQRN